MFPANGGLTCASLIAVALFCAGLFCIAQAQVPMTGAGKGAPGGAAAYSGPGDVVSGAIAWWGLRAYSAADRGNALINLCDNAGANCADASSDATTGNLIVTSRGSDSCATADDCLIHTFYDRIGTNCSGACNAVQATAANMPTLKHNCLNSTLFCAVFSGSQSLQFGGTMSSQAQPWTVSYVALSPDNAATYAVFGNGGTPVTMGTLNSANSVYMYAGSANFTATATVNQWHSIQNIGNGVSSELYIDGTATSPGTNPGTNAIANNLFIGDDSFANFFKSNIVEVGLWDIDFSLSSNANAAAMRNNQKAYWGTP